MPNAKEELLKELVDLNETVKCAEVWNDSYDSDYYGWEKKYMTLKLWYTREEYETFLSDLDYIYDAWYGWQELFWIVWLCFWWLEREEYDWSERWVYKPYWWPDIPEVCKR